jgi:cytochrome b6-f complex iron-sulfur subunit
MTTSRRKLLKGSAGLVVLSSLPCACGGNSSSAPDAAPALEFADGFLEVPLSLYPDLQQVGGFSVVLFRALVIIIAQVEAGTFVCLDALCTHQRCAVLYEPTAREFPCPCHGAVFAESGAVVAGPAQIPLQVYPIEPAGSVLIVDLRDAPIDL